MFPSKVFFKKFCALQLTFYFITLFNSRSPTGVQSLSFLFKIISGIPSSRNPFKKSPFAALSCGVPQGSVLGPILI